MGKYERIGTEKNYFVTMKGKIIARIIKPEVIYDDAETVVQLFPCRHTERFFLHDLSDKEYVARTEHLKHNT
jgi:hypothetical protein